MIAKRMPDATFFVVCAEAPEHKPALFGMIKPVFVRPNNEAGHDPLDPAILIRAGGWLQRTAHQLYGGQWIVQELKPVVHDDGLIRAEAKEKAYGLIMSGPDTPGKRWLTAYLAGQAPKVLKTVDEALADDVDLADERNKQVAALAQAEADELPY